MFGKRRRGEAQWQDICVRGGGENVVENLEANPQIRLQLSCKMMCATWCVSKMQDICQAGYGGKALGNLDPIKDKAWKIISRPFAHYFYFGAPLYKVIRIEYLLK